MPKLTKRSVGSVKATPESDFFVWDDEIKGFGVRVKGSGRKTYIYRYRNTYAQQKSIKIGVHGTITAEQARSIAQKYAGQVADGTDPSSQKEKARLAPTIEKLSKDYLERHSCKNRTSTHEKNIFMIKNIILPRWAHKKVADITRRDVEALHLSLKDMPYKANRFLGLLSNMFTLAVQWEWRTNNPVVGVPRYQEHKRNRWLDHEELARLLVVLEEYKDSNTAQAIHFLLLTGARKREALYATWDQFDLEKGVWTKPAHTTKQKKMAHLPLSLPALGVLKEMKARELSDKYVFPGKKAGQPLKEIKRLWDRITKKAKLEDVRIHDLRHTHASHLVSRGVSLTIVGELLGHTQASTTQRYAHLSDESLRDAANVFGNIYEQSKLAPRIV